MSTPTNTDDMIDSRDVIARIEELEAEREAISSEIDELEDADAVGEAQNALERWDAENGAELAALKALAAEGESFADWEHGETLIRDSYFQEYAEQLADDIGAIDRDAKWPTSCIDWEKAARELQADYTSVEFDGVTYWGCS